MGPLQTNWHTEMSVTIQLELEIGEPVALQVVRGDANNTYKPRDKGTVLVS